MGVRVTTVKKARALARELSIGLDELAAGIDAVQRNASFQAWLGGIARFWRYGPMNRALIRVQRPNATSVMGRLRWQALGRRVRAHARPIVAAGL